jgi:hypothetical protein
MTKTGPRRLADRPAIKRVGSPGKPARRRKRFALALVLHCQLHATLRRTVCNRISSPPQFGGIPTSWAGKPRLLLRKADTDTLWRCEL